MQTKENVTYSLICLSRTLFQRYSSAK